MSSCLIRGAHLVDPANAIDSPTDILIRDGRIAEINPATTDADEVIEANGLLAIPGVVDLAVRLREPGGSQKASIRSELLAAASAGITSVCVPPDTQPVVDNPSVVEWIQLRAQRVGAANVYLLAAATDGLHGQALSALGPMRRAACVGVMQAGAALASLQLARRVMEYADNFGLRLHVVANEHSLSAGSYAHDGAVATTLGLPGNPVSSETCAVAQWIELVADTGVGLHFCRLSSARACELVRRAKHDGLPITADVAAHQLFLTEDRLHGYDSLAHLNPPLRSEADRQALVAALADGTLDAVCSDHQPHEIDAKTNPLPLTQPGISALETLVPLVWALVADGLISASTAVQRLSLAPAAILGIDAGNLATGAVADLSLIDPGTQWTFRRSEMLSSGRNSPFDGREFGARAVRTIKQGRTVFQR